ncbi:response regulator [Paenibacillus sp. IB182496]|uniref:Response regulator n=1 Tax=Paenibacillus sabuli TaxID=2772509 RepID=A0A927BZF9_9BACL|nr:response regulator [Paenibacillus sabuli]MBD2848123.1 response regulator [Paenibacillus sabuli]
MQLLIADDDDYTREGLIDTLPWARLGIARVIQARDGVEAARLAAQTRPEIVLTDIRMPRLSGLEFAEQLIRICPDSQLLFMSGYMEVDYLKRAIKLAAVDFIEKPVKPSEVERAILKTLAQLRERQERQMIRAENVILQQQRLAELLLQGPFEPAQASRLCDATGFPAAGSYIAAVLERRSAAPQETALRETVAGHLGTRYAALVRQTGPKRVQVVAACGAGAREASRLVDWLAALAEHLPSCTIGIGSCAAGLSEVRASCAAAQQAADRSFYEPGSRVFRQMDAVAGTAAGTTAAGTSGLLAECYRLLDEAPEQLPDWLAAVCKRFNECRSPARPEVEALFAACADAILSRSPAHARSSGADAPRDALRACRSIGDAETYMRELARRHDEAMRQAASYSRHVREVLRYVAQHYTDPALDLARIARHMQRSAAHLSVVFRQEAGTTIRQHINDCRIGEAKRLLLSERYKVHEIAELCGYASASYFAKAFKSATGFAPADFKGRRKK